MMRRVTFLLAAWCLWLMMACSQAGAPLSPEQSLEDDGIEWSDEGPLVVFLGNSITAGMGLSEEEAFPAVVAEMLRGKGLPIRIVNAGVSGDTAAGGLSRIDSILEQVPDVIVIELGANDGLRGRPVAETEDALRAIISRAQDERVALLLLGMQMPLSLGAEYAESFSDMYRRIADDMDVPVIESFLGGVGGRRSMNQLDGIHPNAEGHRRLASNVLEPLAEIVESIRR